MSQSREILERRTGSLRGIRSIVHTMKTLTALNATPYEQAAHAIEAYHQTILAGMHAYLSQHRHLRFPKSALSTQIVVVFGSDHGLCGSYNEILAQHVTQQITPQDRDTCRILCVGAQMSDALAGLGTAVETVFLPPASVDGIGRFAQLLTRHLDDLRPQGGDGAIGVSLAYMSRPGKEGQHLNYAPLLPLDPKLLRRFQQEPWVSRSLPSFPMAPDTVFPALVRAHLFAKIYRAAAEAMVSENAARLALMQQAEKSVDDRLETLRATAHRLRQEAITAELLDVIVGFEALKARQTPRRKTRRQTQSAACLMRNGSFKVDIWGNRSRSS